VQYRPVRLGIYGLKAMHECSTDLYSHGIAQESKASPGVGVSLTVLQSSHPVLPDPGGCHRPAGRRVANRQALNISHHRLSSPVTTSDNHHHQQQQQQQLHEPHPQLVLHN
jgi:hypothetical protein